MKREENNHALLCNFKCGVRFLQSFFMLRLLLSMGEQNGLSNLNQELSETKGMYFFENCYDVGDLDGTFVSVKIN